MSASGAGDGALVRESVPAESGAAAKAWLWAALLVSLGGLAGSLFLSLGMGLKACPLCFYQRTFMMSLVAVLGTGLLTGAGGPGRLAQVALPLAAAGLGVALYHVSLEWRGKLECPQGLLGLGTAPQQSLIVFGILTALLAAGTLGAPRARAALAVALVLGALLAAGSTVANPPTKPPDPADYEKPPDVCRPPRHPG
jgi:disulfide bond formation protein DsbB